MQTTTDNQPTDFQQLAAVAAFKNLMKRDSYYTWTVRNIALTLGREHCLTGRDWNALEALCSVEWGAMGPELATAVRTKTAELLGLPVEAFATPEAVTMTRSLVDRLLGRNKNTEG